ncbi:MAG: D-glycerate dehydrogenase [archaeon]|nr:D-glycerate dehydrogenase [archaeon]
MSKKRVFVSRKILESGINLLKRHFEVRVYPKDRVISRKELINGVKWCDGLLCLLTDKIDKEILDANPNLKVVANYAVGFNNIDIKYAKEKGIIVTNTPGVLTDAVIEHTFGLMLAISKRIVESDTFTRKGKYHGWEPLLLLGTQLKGKTLGIIGLGRIGSGVAEIAHKGMGMDVLYHDINRDKGFEKKNKAKFLPINSLLKQSDFITLHVPLLPSTKHLIGAKQLSMMKKTAYLVNTSRGQVIDEEALVKVLQKGGIRGAALDVFENEPKLARGLAKLKNVVLTPHIASATIEARSAMSVLAAKNIVNVLKGKKPLTPVKGR